MIEDADPTRPGWNWTALLPVLTDRAYLGGLDPGACVEHTFVGMRDGRLNGRPEDKPRLPYAAKSRGCPRRARA